MAIIGVTLFTDAVRIRTARTPGYNSASRIGSWCTSVITWIGNTGDPLYNTLLSQSAAISNEENINANTATRVGTWMINAVKYRNYYTKWDYLNLLIRAEGIQNEKRWSSNTPERIGKWFIDYLFHIDYTGDEEVGLGFNITVSVTAGYNMQFPCHYIPGTTPNTRRENEFIIDWGDGTEEYHKNASLGEVTHRYNVAGVYDINVVGLVEYVGNTPVANINMGQRLVSINSWGELGIIEIVNLFYGTTNLFDGNVPAAEEKTWERLYRFTQVFYGATIKGGVKTVSADLLKSATNLRYANNAFLGWNSGGTPYTVPTGIFDHSLKIINFENCFAYSNGYAVGQTPKTNGYELWQRINYPNIFPIGELDHLGTSFDKISGRACYYMAGLTGASSAPEVWRNL